MKKLQLIHCGVGGFGKSWLTDFTQVSPDFEVAAIVDLTEENLAAAGEVTGLPPERLFRTLEAALDRIPADAVLTVTPLPVHVQHARLAFSRGLHLMTEKPFAANVEHAQEMLRLSRDAGRRLLISQNYRYNAPFVHLRKMVAGRELGELGGGHIDFYLAADFRNACRTMEFPLLVDMAIHHFDLIRNVTGRNIVKVTALSFNPPGSTFQHHAGLKMLLELEGGAAFSYSGDWSARGRATNWSGDWRLQGSEGSIIVRNDEVVLTRSESWGKNTHEETIAIPSIPFSSRAATLHEFAEVIRSGRPSELDGANNLWSIGAVLAGVESARTGQAIDVAELIAER